jgi:hypothetical protein
MALLLILLIGKKRKKEKAHNPDTVEISSAATCLGAAFTKIS